ncbi:hypothetical protein MSG28_000308 [Choristoneura fumiferana]|uniref:Uncharacterized protein n=1 Tax=Choristoneura fumiferana TaxID=7141 RepID=A0ACC0K060_CHOFU|nr:hypothetical protein MSG28_000308 [Choristoneura fumiferana]
MGRRRASATEYEFLPLPFRVSGVVCKQLDANRASSRASRAHHARRLSIFGDLDTTNQTPVNQPWPTSGAQAADRVKIIYEAEQKLGCSCASEHTIDIGYRSGAGADNDGGSEVTFRARVELCGQQRRGRGGTALRRSTLPAAVAPRRRE